MAILFPMKREMAILFFVKRDLDPPFPTLSCCLRFQNLYHLSKVSFRVYNNRQISSAPRQPFSYPPRFQIRKY